MTAIPIAFRSNPGKYSFLGTARLINAYAEAQGADGKSPMAVLPAPGLTEFTEVTDTPGRGTIYLPDLDCAYVIHSSGAYKVIEDGTATRIGTIPGSDFVQLSRNQASDPQVTVHCAAGDFFIENDIVVKVTDTDLPATTSQDQVGGYTAYGLEDRRVFLSSLNETQTIDGTDFATAEQSPDPLVRVKGDRGDLYVFKTETMEPWRNTGNADFPFEPVPGTLVKKGLLSANALIDFDNSLGWPAHDYQVVRLNGYQAQRISTHAIERTIQGETSPSSIIGFPYTSEGHAFATLTGTDWTRSYDAATQFWHERESWQLGYWRARFPFRAWNKWIFQDALSGKLLELDEDAFDEDGDPLVWGMDSPTLVSPTGAGRIDWIRVDFLTGHGAVVSTAQGYDPILMLSWSVDGGNTFTGNRHLSLGRSGNYKTKVTTRRLGRFGDKGVVFRLRVSDPVPRAIAGIELGVTPLVRT
jgi:hypothetical protein